MRAIRGWLGAVLVLAISIALFLAVWGWMDDRCQRKGGHTVNVYRGTICVSADGRVIE